MHRPLSAILAILAFAAAVNPAAAEGARRFAVIAGNNFGLSRSEPLRYAEQDASRMASLLQEIGGVDPGDMTVLFGAGEDDLRAAMDDMLAKVSRTKGDAVFVFYYSGHADSGWLRMDGRGISLTELRRRIEAMPAKVRIAIVDACQSGEITRAKGGKVVSPFLEERPVNAKGLVILTSASAEENAQESDVLESAFFSHHLMSGLRGPADSSGDGRVSVIEAYNYAYRYTVQETEQTTGGAQHPMFLYALEGEGEVDLTAIGQAISKLVLSPELDGAFLVVSGKGAIEAETVKAEGEQMILALAPGSYSIKRRERDELWTAAVSLELGETVALGPDAFKRSALVEAAAKGPGTGKGKAGEVGRPLPLTDVPLGGGRWPSGSASLSGADSTPEKPRSFGPTSDVSKSSDISLARNDDAMLWPPLALGISLSAPGVAQMIEGRPIEGTFLLGGFVGSAVGAGVLAAGLDRGDSAAVQAIHVGGAAALGLVAFYVYSFAAIDAFYSNTVSGLGTPNLDDMTVDLGVSAAPSLIETGPKRVDVGIGGGLGLGFALTRFFVLGVRDVMVHNGGGIATLQIAPEARFRALVISDVMLSASLGLGAQIHLDRRDGEIERAWALYPYLAGGVHYFPSRSWSLDFGLRGLHSIKSRRMPGGIATAPSSWSVEYVGGLTWYH